MIIIDYKDRRPIYEQVVERFQELILHRVLEPGTQLPSVRNLAMELSINPNTIQRAYTELERKGYIYTVKGRGSFIAGNGRLLNEKMGEILHEFDVLVKESKGIGISRDELIQRINEGYKEGIKDD